MRRRSFLLSTSTCGFLLGSGCVTLGEDAGPLTFGISNWRNRRYMADVRLRKGDDAILDGRFDIPAKQPTDEDPVGVLLEDIVRVTNGDTVEARVQLDGDEFTGRYEVSCNQSENAENNFFFRIYSSEDRGMEFTGSEC